MESSQPLDKVTRVTSPSVLWLTTSSSRSFFSDVNHQLAFVAVVQHNFHEISSGLNG